MSKDRDKRADDKDDDRKTLGERLREAREYLGFSQDQVGTFLGVSRSALSLMESGQRKVDALELKKLAGLYKRSVGYFTGEEEDDSVGADVRECRPADQELAYRRHAPEPEVDARILGREIAASGLHFPYEPAPVGEHRRDLRAGREARELHFEPVHARTRVVQQHEPSADRVDRDVHAPVVVVVRRRDAPSGSGRSRSDCSCPR